MKTLGWLVLLIAAVFVLGFAVNRGYLDPLIKGTPVVSSSKGGVVEKKDLGSPGSSEKPAKSVLGKAHVVAGVPLKSESSVATPQKSQIRKVGSEAGISPVGSSVWEIVELPAGKKVASGPLTVSEKELKALRLSKSDSCNSGSPCDKLIREAWLVIQSEIAKAGKSGCLPQFIIDNDGSGYRSEMYPSLILSAQKGSVRQYIRCP